MNYLNEDIQKDEMLSENEYLSNEDDTNNIDVISDIETDDSYFFDEWLENGNWLWNNEEFYDEDFLNNENMRAYFHYIKEKDEYEKTYKQELDKIMSEKDIVIQDKKEIQPKENPIAKIDLSVKNEVTGKENFVKMLSTISRNFENNKPTEKCHGFKINKVYSKQAQEKAKIIKQKREEESKMTEEEKAKVEFEKTKNNILDLEEKKYFIILLLKEYSNFIKKFEKDFYPHYVNYSEKTFDEYIISKYGIKDCEKDIENINNKIEELYKKLKTNYFMPDKSAIIEKLPPPLPKKVIPQKIVQLPIRPRLLPTPKRNLENSTNKPFLTLIKK